MGKKRIGSFASNAIVFVALSAVFIFPFVYIILMASKNTQEAANLSMALPSQNMMLENLKTVIAFRDYEMFRALYNSTILTLCSISLVVIFAGLFAFVAQRRNDRIATILMGLLAAGLMIPPAVVPTVFLLRSLHIYKTLFGMVMIDVALFMPFATIIFRTAMTSIPRELDEASYIDGAGPLDLFFKVILPLLKPAVVTVVVTNSVNIFNDFVGPLYFLPGAKNVTAPLTLYNYISMFKTEWNLLFANVLVVSIIPLLIFIFFQRQLVSGMMGGAVKG